MAGLKDATALIARDPARAAAISLVSERVGLTAEQVEGILTRGSTAFSVAPSGIMAYARFMAARGMLRKVPDSWKDVFFPLIADRDES